MPVLPPLLPEQHLLAGGMAGQEGRDEETCPPSLRLLSNNPPSLLVPSLEAQLQFKDCSGLSC